MNVHILSELQSVPPFTIDNLVLISEIRTFLKAEVAGVASLETLQERQRRMQEAVRSLAIHAHLRGSRILSLKTFL